MLRRLLIWAVFLVVAGNAGATIPTTLNYQGRIKLNGGSPVPDSSGNTVQFVLYTVPNGGAGLWTETWNSGTSCVTTTSGLFNVVLGTWTPLALPFDQQYYLEISWYNSGSSSFVTLAHREPLTASRFAYKAKKV